MTPPEALRAFPSKGTTPVAWQSQFHGVRWLRPCEFDGRALEK